MTTAESDTSKSNVKLVSIGIRYDCRGRCLHKVHVRGGVMIRVEPTRGRSHSYIKALR